MQQLALFSNPISLSHGSQGHKRIRRKSQSAVHGPRWDLWTQEAESEKEMALFFLDIRNFTPLVANHQAFDVIHIMRKLFSTFQNIIRTHHGRIVETSGDGFYAAFGFNEAVTEAANAAVQAGMAILKTLENLNTQSFEKNLSQRIDVGIGIHVGKVATGSLHIGGKEHFIVMGYPVNIASRLQAATKELNNNFIVSSEVFELLKMPPPNRYSVTTNLKGINHACEVYLIGSGYQNKV